MSDERTLPWNAGGPDSELVRLIESGRIPAGRALDLGTGPGHDAIFLAQRGFRVTAIDISPAAIALARQNARKARARVVFKAQDVLASSPAELTATFVNARGCLHIRTVRLCSSCGASEAGRPGVPWASRR